jgi:hypothetical protein
MSSSPTPMGDVMKGKDGDTSICEIANSDICGATTSKELCSSTGLGEAIQSSEMDIEFEEGYEYSEELPDSIEAPQIQQDFGGDAQTETVAEYWAGSMDEVNVDQPTLQDNSYHDGRFRRERQREEYNVGQYLRGPRREWELRGYQAPYDRRRWGNREQGFRGRGRGYRNQRYFREHGPSTWIPPRPFYQRNRRWVRDPNYRRVPSEEEATGLERHRGDQDWHPSE